MTKQETLLERLNRVTAQRNLEQNSKESLDWFQTNARKMVGKRQAKTLLLREQTKARDIGKRLPIGKMFTYAYTPKGIDSLPYYDRFPLGFYVGPAKGGFYMLNLHYLAPKHRAILFDALQSIAINYKGHGDDKKLRITYELLTSSRKFRFFKPCFKHYLVKHLESRIVEIPYQEWGAALFLPTADFVGASPTRIWSDSILGVNK